MCKVDPGEGGLPEAEAVGSPKQKGAGHTRRGARGSPGCAFVGSIL